MSPELLGYVSVELNTETASVHLKSISAALKINTAFF